MTAAEKLLYLTMTLETHQAFALKKCVMIKNQNLFKEYSETGQD